MEYKDILKQFKENQKINEVNLFKIQNVYNNLSVSELTGTKNEIEAVKRTHDLIKNKLPDVTEKDINDFFLVLAECKNSQG